MKLEDRESLIIHIEGLQATLTKRNNRIADLEAIIEKMKMDPVSTAEQQKYYKKGWQDCAIKLMEATKEAAVDLAKVHKKAFDEYRRTVNEEVEKD